MIEFRRIVKASLKAIHPRVYFQSAPKKAEYPYLVYDITNVYDDGENSQTIDLDVDGWDNIADTTRIETLMENVNQNINKMTETAETLAVSFYLDRILFLTDDDPLLKRRKYMYQARLFKRE
jgi:flagellar capping protein FliD